jgi:uncharacterized RDD family membrane protein YckC
MIPRPEAASYAGLAPRLGALLVDSAIALALVACAALATGFAGGPIQALERLSALGDGWRTVLAWVAFATCESWTWRGTPGKRACSIVVERPDGGGIGYPRALWRNAAKVLSIVTLPASIALLVFEPRRRAIHDLLAGTVVRDLAPAPARRARGVAVVALAVAVPLAYAAGLQRYGRLLVDARQVRAAIPPRFDLPRELFPGQEPVAFLDEQHLGCFDESYKPSWLWNRFDRAAYLKCLDRRYAERMAGALTLEEPSWTPAHEPEFGRLEFTVRLREGKLPEQFGQRRVTECGSGFGGATGEGPAARFNFAETAPGVYRTADLVGLQPRDGCQLHYSLTWGRWDLGAPLVVAMPTPDPVRLEAKARRLQELQKARERALACLMVEAGRLPPLARGAGSGNEALEAAVRALSSPDPGERRDAAGNLGKLAPATRGAIGAMVDALRDISVDTRGALILALLGADPTGRVIAPALRCLTLDASPQVRGRAGAALTAVGDRAGPAALTEAFASADEGDRISLVWQFQRYPVPVQSVAPVLIARLRQEPLVRVRAEILGQLARLNSDAVEIDEAIEAARQDPAEEVQEAAASALRDLQQFRRQRQAAAR